MNQRVLMVKGIGSVSVKPDWIVITISLSPLDPDYTAAVKRANDLVEKIRNTLVRMGFDRTALKTTDFRLDTSYDSYRDDKGEYHRKFIGYTCHHKLKLEFDLDTKKMGQAIMSIVECEANPELKIAFSVKDKNAVSAELLKSAVSNAKEKAVILAEAAGVKLGEVQAINYNWGEVHLYSETRFENAICSEPDIEPDDIKASDTATIVWTIE